MKRCIKEIQKDVGSWGEICESANQACLEPCSRQAIGVVKIHGSHDWPHEPKKLADYLYIGLRGLNVQVLCSLVILLTNTCQPV